MVWKSLFVQITCFFSSPYLAMMADFVFFNSNNIFIWNGWERSKLIEDVIQLFSVHFQISVEQQPSNYWLHFKRAARFWANEIVSRCPLDTFFHNLVVVSNNFDQIFHYAWFLNRIVHCPCCLLKPKFWPFWRRIIT